jgi:hypothetical protein
MVSYIKDNRYDTVQSDDFQSYFPVEVAYRTDIGVAEENNEVPVLNEDDNIFSEIYLTEENSSAYKKASEFVAIFTRVFAKEKVPNRAYSKFVQNKNELPDIELDWIFQYFRVSFLFSVSDEDYFCITKYDEKTEIYDSKTGPLKKDNYKMVAEEVMQEVR